MKMDRIVRAIEGAGDRLIAALKDEQAIWQVCLDNPELPGPIASVPKQSILGRERRAKTYQKRFLFILAAKAPRAISERRRPSGHSQQASPFLVC